jgi:hypothetical protein
LICINNRTARTVIDHSMNGTDSGKTGRKEAVMSRLVRWSCAGVTLATFAGISMSVEPANAVVYCQYVEYPAGCIVRPGVVLRPRPVGTVGVGTVGVGAPGVGVRRGTPTNRGGPVDRAGRR